MKARELIMFMDQWTAKENAESWDNVGFQIGDDTREVRNIILAMDLDKNTLDYALKKDGDMIITHHPFIFSGLKTINNRSYDGSLVMELLKNNLVSYAAHTNLDKLELGLNHRLAEIFKLEDSEVLSIETGEEVGYGRVGNIEPIILRDYICQIKENLDVTKLIAYGDLDREIRRLALVGGSGSDFIRAAYEKEADLLITGDIKYHDAQAAVKLGLNLVDPGHFHTEKIVLPLIKEKLLEFNKQLNIYIYNEPSPIYQIL